MGVGTAQHAAIQQSSRRKVGRVAGLAADLAWSFNSRDRCADQGRSHSFLRVTRSLSTDDRWLSAPMSHDTGRYPGSYRRETVRVSTCGSEIRRGTHMLLLIGLIEGLLLGLVIARRSMALSYGVAIWICTMVAVIDRGGVPSQLTTDTLAIGATLFTALFGCWLGGFLRSRRVERSEQI